MRRFLQKLDAYQNFHYSELLCVFIVLVTFEPENHVVEQFGAENIPLIEF